ncbi:Neuronal acetylcholine receptor subunit alpha-5 [Atta colombica]|uniref:Neuronal acetylcholine receptor subunit alpha-5 n=1 Tax=Atta colombica TaxID=520822 RepID=A0A151I3C1_9HYME|nr:Neuronal acetylcholine receptor subunit alpha-5 [Atta colombica]
MRIFNVFGFFGILCISYDQSCTISNVFIDAFALSINLINNVNTWKCKKLEQSSPLMRLKNHLFCDYDNTVHPNYPKTTNVTMHLMPKLINFQGEGKLSLHSWMSLAWMDSQLTWTPSDYDGITFIHMKSWRIWMPSLYVNDSFFDCFSGEMSSDQYKLPVTECLLFNSGSVSCVPAVKFISKCNPDYTYWPYDKHQCRVTFLLWMHTGEEVDLLIDGNGISMSDYTNDTKWDFKFTSSMREATKFKCCPNDTFPRINYNFLLTRHHGKHYLTVIVPAIALMLLTLIVLCLDLKSVERMMVASANFICHLLCIFFLFWILPFNRVNPPNILLFYRESLALATFVMILTAMLRKLENMSTQTPNWILFTTTFVLSNKVGRFLILKNNKIADKDVETEGSSESEISLKESSWKYFATIIDWLFFFCLIFIYIIILIILLPY